MLMKELFVSSAMASSFLSLLLLIIASPALLLLAPKAPAAAAAAAQSVEGGYWYYGSGFPPANIHASLFTHLFYAFVSMDASTFVVQPASDDNQQIESFSSTVRASNPSVKTLLSIGGGSADANAFSAMASNPTSRRTFIQSSINLANQYGFNGLDLDWEFPQSNTDMSNLATLLSEWRQAAGSLLLTAAVHFNATREDISVTTYPVAAIAQNLDWVNLMEYDLHGSWEPQKTGEHTALYDTGSQSIDYGVTNWLAAGLPTEKAVMGLAMYGRTWYLQDASQNGVGAVATGAGPDGGEYTYDQIQQFNKGSNAVCQVDDTTKCAYCYGSTSNGILWVGYDNTDTIATKVSYLKEKNLRGYFFWSLGGDQNGDLSKQASQSLS